MCSTDKDAKNGYRQVTHVRVKETQRSSLYKRRVISAGNSHTLNRLITVRYILEDSSGSRVRCCFFFLRYHTCETLPIIAELGVSRYPRENLPCYRLSLCHANIYKKPSTKHLSGPTVSFTKNIISLAKQCSSL